MANSPDRASTPAAICSAPRAWRPDVRLTGIIPSAGRRWRVRQLSRYSALPTKLSGRRTAMINATESKNEMWLAAMIAGPRAGTCSKPSIRIGHSSRYSGRTATRAGSGQPAGPEAARLGSPRARLDARQARGVVLERHLQPGAVDELAVGPHERVEAVHPRHAHVPQRARRGLDGGAGRPLPRLVARTDQLDERVDAHGSPLTRRAPVPALPLPQAGWVNRCLRT